MSDKNKNKKDSDESSSDDESSSESSSTSVSSDSTNSKSSDEGAQNPPKINEAAPPPPQALAKQPSPPLAERPSSATGRSSPAQQQAAPAPLPRTQSPSQQAPQQSKDNKKKSKKDDSSDSDSDSDSSDSSTSSSSTSSSNTSSSSSSSSSSSNSSSSNSSKSSGSSKSSSEDELDRAMQERLARQLQQDEAAAQNLEKPWSAKKEAFCARPEWEWPASTSVLLHLGQDHEYLRNLEETIVALRQHAIRAQRHELTVRKSFPSIVPVDPETEKVEQKQRNDWEVALEIAQKQRRDAKGLLWDAIQERDGLLRSYDLRQQNALNFEKHRNANAEQAEIDKQQAAGNTLAVDAFFAMSIFWQIAILVCWVLFTDFETRVPTVSTADVVGAPSGAQYVHLIFLSLFVFVGLGSTLSYPRRYAWSGLGLSLFLGSYAILWGVLVRAFFAYQDSTTGDFFRVQLNFEYIIDGLYCAAAVLIAFGSTLGRTTSRQLLVIMTIGVVLYQTNTWIWRSQFLVVDPGMARSVHIFGSIFGFACSIVVDILGNPTRAHVFQNSPGYFQGELSLMGTLFLWVFWPSFNALAVPGAVPQGISVVFTVLALASSTTAAYAFSRWLGGSRFGHVEIRAATIVGGIVSGSCASFMINPFWAIVMGGCSGLICVLLLIVIGERIERVVGVYDANFALYTHGLFGIVASIIGAIVARSLEGDVIFGTPYDTLFASRPTQNGDYQIASLIITIVLALFGGFLAGLVAIIPIFKRGSTATFSDAVEWQVLGTTGFPFKITEMINKNGGKRRSVSGRK